MDKQDTGETLFLLGHSNSNQVDIFISIYPTTCPQIKENCQHVALVVQ